MAEETHTNDIYLESGQKKALACSVAWPGWCRAGKDGETAVQALFETSPRYAQIVRAAGLEFDVPASAASFNIIERLAGNSSTDYGVPAMSLSSDDDPVGDAELQRMEMLLEAYWQAFNEAVGRAEGKELRKGPRGGGRDLASIVAHVEESAAGYLRMLGWTMEALGDENSAAAQAHLRREITAGLRAAVAGETATVGPRGGKRWGPRYFVRRLGWHVLDHTWEIEDRIL